MNVETRSTSQYWYGRWSVNGQRFSKRLRVTVRGRPGSPEFLASRVEATAALDELLAEARQQHRSEDLVQRIHEIKFGRRVGSIPLARIADEWKALPRRRPLATPRAQYGATVLGRFVKFMRGHHPNIREMAAVTAEMAEQFMASEEQRGIAGRTYNEILSLLRGLFERLRVRAGMLANPFSQGLVTKDENTIVRRPFTLDELDRLFEAAAEIDPEIHDLITVGACTALRRGDACCLRWRDIDIPNNRIRIQTRKTGEPVALPIFPRLRRVLEARRRIGQFVFPGLAAAYEREPWTVNNRLNAVFKAAGLRPSDPDEPAQRKPPTLDAPLPDEEDMRAEVFRKIDALTPEQVAPRIKTTMREVFDLYSSGAALPDIARQLGASKGSVSNYLARIEKTAGHPIVRKAVARLRTPPPAPTPEEPAARRDGKGRIRVNPRGFHALRATFTTQALTAGVPVEVVKLITGHTLTETVLRHYFNPDEDAVFAKMQRAMPKLLTGSRTHSV